MAKKAKPKKMANGGLFNPRRSTAIGLGGISPVMGAAVGGLFGSDKKPRYSALPQGRTIVRGGADIQAPGAVGPDVTLKDKAMLAQIKGGQPVAAPAQAAAPAGGGGFGSLLNRAANNIAQQRAAAAPAQPAAPSTTWGRGYSDGGKVFHRKPNGKGC